MESDDKSFLVGRIGAKDQIQFASFVVRSGCGANVDLIRNTNGWVLFKPIKRFERKGWLLKSLGFCDGCHGEKREREKKRNFKTTVLQLNSI